jgi:hypothetical protein
MFRRRLPLCAVNLYLKLAQQLRSRRAKSFGRRHSVPHEFDREP